MRDDSFARGLEFVNETQIATYFQDSQEVEAQQRLF